MIEYHYELNADFGEERDRAERLACRLPRFHVRDGHSLLVPENVAPAKGQHLGRAAQAHESAQYYNQPPYRVRAGINDFGRLVSGHEVIARPIRRVLAAKPTNGLRVDNSCFTAAPKNCFAQATVTRVSESCRRMVLFAVSNSFEGVGQWESGRALSTNSARRPVACPANIVSDSFVPRCFPLLGDEPTTAAVQRLLNALAGDTPPEPIVRELLDRAVCRLEVLSAAQLHRSYPRLARPPLNLQTNELLGGVVAGLIPAMRKVRPRTPREFFGLAAQHIRWQLNDLARLLDQRSAVLMLDEGGVPAPPSTGSVLTPNARRMLEAIDGLPEEEREAFNLIRVQGLTYPEAAEVLAVSVKTVQRRVNRARLLLAERLDDLRPASSASETPPGDTPSP